jgi:hypothetical protein
MGRWVLLVCIAAGVGTTTAMRATFLAASR